MERRKETLNGLNVPQSMPYILIKRQIYSILYLLCILNFIDTRGENLASSALTLRVARQKRGV